MMRERRTHHVVVLGVKGLEEGGGPPAGSKDDDVLLGRVLGELLSGSGIEVSGCTIRTVTSQPQHS
jgi:hypothetical protein